MTKKISKIIVYYEDGTFEEIANSLSGVQSEPDKKDVGTSPVAPTLTPHMWPPYPPFTVTYSNGNVPLRHMIINDKYTITSTGNGNVDFSK
jgi:hypothetical protein